MNCLIVSECSQNAPFPLPKPQPPRRLDDLDLCPHSKILDLPLDKYYGFSALTLLVGWQEGHSACKQNWMLICWWWWFNWSSSHLRVRLSLPSQSSFLAAVKFRVVCHSDTGLSTLSWKLQTDHLLLLLLLVLQYISLDILAKYEIYTIHHS